MNFKYLFYVLISIALFSCKKQLNNDPVQDKREYFTHLSDSITSEHRIVFASVVGSDDLTERQLKNARFLDKRRLYKNQSDDYVGLHYISVNGKPRSDDDIRHYAIILSDRLKGSKLYFLIDKNDSTISLPFRQNASKRYIVLDKKGAYAGSLDLKELKPRIHDPSHSRVADESYATVDKEFAAAFFSHPAPGVFCTFCGSQVQSYNGVYLDCYCFVCGFDIEYPAGVEDYVWASCSDDGEGGGGGGDGGGGDDGAGHGGGSGGTGLVVPEPGEADAALGTDCNSFVFTKTSTANWQEAGLNNIRLKWVWIGGSGVAQTREVYVNHIVFGLPMVYANGQTVSPGKAATFSAQAAQQAKYDTYRRFRDTPLWPDDATVIQYYKTALHTYMMVKGGTAGVTGSGSPSIVFRNEERSSVSDPYDCE